MHLILALVEVARVIWEAVWEGVNQVKRRA